MHEMKIKTYLKIINVNIFLDLDAMIDANLARGAHGGFSCKVCGKAGSTRQNARNHIETHLHLNIACNICGKSYSTRNSLNVHKSSIHRTDVNKS